MMGGKSERKIKDNKSRIKFRYKGV